jgi:uroporphyrinogen decarboxylase
VTHRERLLLTLNHREPDRIPVDLSSTQVTAISLQAYKNLRRYLGLSPSSPVIPDRIQQICIPDQDILEKFEIGVRGLWPLMNANDFEDEDDGIFLHHVDEWGLGYRMKKEGGVWYDLYVSPMESVDLSPAYLSHYSWPAGGDLRRIAGLREQAVDFRETGYPVFLKSVCAGMLEMAIRLRGMENCLMDLLGDKENAGKLLDQILKVKIDYWEMALDHLGDVVDVIAEADDFGTQTSQLISHEVFREIIKPRQIELISCMKKKAPQAKIFFHSCGNIRPILPDFIEMGIDIINPVHIRARGMKPAELKRDFGRDITFWGGGIDTQETLPHGNAGHIRDEVKRNIDVLAPEGGFVFNTIHNIQGDVPAENIVTMYETVLSCGWY